jgi:hypothetical protein
LDENIIFVTDLFRKSRPAPFFNELRIKALGGEAIAFSASLISFQKQVDLPVA